jgi:L-fuconolactonase
VTVLVDAHTHVVSHDETAYPLVPTALPNGAWYHEARVDADELVELMAAAGVDRAVFVQPSGAYSTDNRYLVDALARHGDRCAGVCTLALDPDVDAGAPAAAATELRRLVRDHGVHGTRIFALAFDGTEGWLGDPRTYPVWEEARALGAHVVVTAFTAQLPALERTLDAFPDLPVSVDHCAFPDLTGRPWTGLEPLLALADRPNLFLKVSSYVLVHAAAVGDPAEVVALLAGAYGADRLAWGSDYPQHHDQPYAELVALAVRSAASLSPVDRDRFLGGTTAALFPHLGR